MDNVKLFDPAKLYTSREISQITGLSLWWVRRIMQKSIPHIKADDTGDAPYLAKGVDLNEWYESRRAANERVK